MAYNSHRKRSFAKAVSFRLISITTDLVIIYLLTRKVVLSLGIAAATNITSTLFYYLHERAWDRVAWGKEAE